MSKHYTVTVHIARRGTWRHGAQKKSGPGHMFYTLYDGENEFYSYGFAPEGEKGALDGWSKQGKPSDTDYNNYDKGQTRSFTIEVTKEQYDKMRDFGKNPQKYGFGMDYNGPSHSCVDFTIQALREGGLRFKPGGYPSPESEGRMYPHNNYGFIQRLDNPQLPNAVVRENSRETVPGANLPINANYIKSEQAAVGNNMEYLSSNNRKIAQQCETKLIAACKAHGLVADSPQDYTNIAMALTAKCVAADMHKIEKLDIKKEDYSVYALSYEPQLKLASVMANEVVNIPAHESAEKIQQMEQAQARQSQERQLAQEQSQQRGMSIG